MKYYLLFLYLNFTLYSFFYTCFVVTSNVCIDDVAQQEGWHGRVWV